MGQHGLLFQDPAYKYHTKFKDHVESILSVGDDIPPAPGSVRRFQEKVDYYEAGNENTVIGAIMPYILKDTFTPTAFTKEVLLNQVEPETPWEAARFNEIRAQLVDNQAAVLEFWDHGIVTTHDIDFTRTLLPNRYRDLGYEKKLAVDLAKEKGMTNPRPDFALGIKRGTIHRPSPPFILSERTQTLLLVSPLMEHTFLIVEAKSNGGSIIKAHQQQRRGGSTILNAELELRQRAGLAIGVGPCYKTFIFSVCCTGGVFEVWVHWIELNETAPPRFHMNSVCQKSLRDADALLVTRNWMSKIIQWGGIARRAELDALHQALYAREPYWLQQEVEERAAKRNRTG